MKKAQISKPIIPLVAAYVLLLLVAFILPFFSVEGYSIVRNTTSHLGAQYAPLAWIMNIEFALLGVSSIYAGVMLLRRYPWQMMLIIIFGASLVLTAIFQHAPIVDIAYDAVEDLWHSRFASITGFSFTLFAISAAFILKPTSQRLMAISAAILATLLSILMFGMEDYMGLFQRGIFIVSFAWLIYFFQSLKSSASSS